MSKTKNPKLVISGFKTKKQIDAFLSWYDNSGEQQAAYFFESLKDQGKLDVDFMPVERSAKSWDAQNATMNVKFIMVDSSLDD